MGSDEARRLARQKERAEATAKRVRQQELKRMMKVTGEDYTSPPILTGMRVSPQSQSEQTTQATHALGSHRIELGSPSSE